MLSDSSSLPRSPTSAEVRFTSPEPSLGPALWALARRSGVEENSPYAYLMWAEYFSGTSVVAEVDRSPVGFVTGFRVPGAPERVFVWQVAVDERQRGRGIGAAMLDALVDRLPWCRFLEATVTPSNTASAALFRGFAERRGAIVAEDVLFGAEHFPEGAHEPEVRFRIGPLGRQHADP